MKVLVTGASGLIGRHTVELLLTGGHAVRTLQRGDSLSPDVPHVHADVAADPVLITATAIGCDAVVHLAGRGDVAESRRDPGGSIRLNALGALYALEAARAAGASFVLASTQRVYPPSSGLCQENAAPAPDSPYGFAKLAAEQWCRMESEQYGLRTTVLRLFSVYGPWQQPNGGSGVVAIFAHAARNGTPLRVQSRGQRDFTDVRDAARGIRLAVEHPATGFRLVNLATGVGTSFGDLAQAVVQAFDSRSPILHDAVHDTGQDLVAHIGAARACLGYEPSISLQDGLAHYRAWLEQRDPI